MPQSIKCFTIAYIAHGVIMLLHGILMRDRLDADTVQLLGEFGLPFVLAIRFGLIALLAWGVSIRANNFAKWAVVVFIAGMVFRIPQAWGGIAEGNVRAIVWAFGFLTGVSAVCFLFAPGARYWFTGKGRSVKADAAVFD